jgi:uncharacterized RDD family membrane protein YckC
MEAPPFIDPNEEETEVTTADLAGFWVRLAAFVIDMVLLVGTSWAIALLVDRISGPRGLFEFASPSNQVLFGLTGAFSIAYFPWCWRHGGQTLGKRALGIRVIRTDARQLDWNASLIRFLGYVLCWACLSIPFLVLGFDARKQGLHDKMAGTYVIMVPKKKLRVLQHHARAAIEHV